MNPVPHLYRNLINPWQTPKEIGLAAKFINKMCLDLTERQCRKTGTYLSTPVGSPGAQENFRYWQQEIYSMYRLDGPDRAW